MCSEFPLARSHHGIFSRLSCRDVLGTPHGTASYPSSKQKSSRGGRSRLLRCRAGFRPWMYLAEQADASKPLSPLPRRGLRHSSVGVLLPVSRPARSASQEWTAALAAERMRAGVIHTLASKRNSTWHQAKRCCTCA